MLDALSPVDGRYRRHTQTLATWLSEQGLIQHRVEVEVEYFLELVKILPQLADFPQDKVDALRAVHLEFSAQDAQWVKDQERITNHDVKAVEYFVKDAMDKLGVGAWKEFVHFGLTSQDVNNTAIPLSLKRATEGVVLPLLDEVISDLSRLALEWKDVPMLARTHGQPASPVTLGKELQVFVERLRSQRVGLADAVYAAKFGGATGQFNAHRVAYPEVDWPAFGQAFVEGKLGLTRTPLTTQIEPYDHLAAWCDALRRIHTVILDFDRDVWTYISMDYFKQKIVAGEVGSSAMPHKVNPIDFENSEGNLGVANVLLGHFAEKLPCLPVAARPHRQHRDAQPGRAPWAQRHRHECHPQGVGQVGAERGQDRRGLGGQLGHCGRSHPNHPSARSLPRAVRGLEGFDPDERHHQPEGDA